MLNKKIILIGYSGHGFVVADTALENKLNLIGYTENSLRSYNPFNLSYLGKESEHDFIGWSLCADFLIGVGDNYIREKIFQLVFSKGAKVETLIHTSSSISRQSKIGMGVFVNRGVLINAFATIGNNVLLNTGCIIDHECVIGDSVHVAPGAVLAGNVEVGERSFIGANSVIRQGVKIGKDVVVGAGTVVLNNILDGRVAVGNPSRFI